MDRPGVGIGVIIQNKEGKILIGKRKGSHSPYYSIPGGHLENGETFEAAAIKEVWEETGLTLLNPKVFCVTNNLRTYNEEKKHYVSINLFSNQYEGQPELKEPHKSEMWMWCDPTDLPQPHFDASETAVACYLNNKFYLSSE